MTLTGTLSGLHNIEEVEYRRRIRAWTMYDWANSAFITSVLGAILPIYYSRVAGATLPSEATATAYWSLGLSISLLIIAILSPILGTVSDIVHGKKRFLGLFMGLGVVSTTALVLVQTGDWLLASIVFIIARVGFGSANVFYDSLLPHIAREEDQDMVSARGYAFGYLGGGILLAINAAMLRILPGTWGARLSFVSVAIWWAVFSIPILTRVPEPPTAATALEAGQNVINTTVRELKQRFKDIRLYRELVKYLIAFLIYNDGIGTIIGVGVIYGAELGFGDLELVLALLLIQFAGTPFALIFGQLPNSADKRRAIYLAFILFSLVAIPTTGIVAAHTLPADITGAPLPAYEATGLAAGEGVYTADNAAIQFRGEWTSRLVTREELTTGPISRLLSRNIQDTTYVRTTDPDARVDFLFNGQEVKVLYSIGPENGTWSVEMDGQPMVDEGNGRPIGIDANNPTVRYGVHQTFMAEEPGVHTLSIINNNGGAMTIAQMEVLSPIRRNNLLVIFGLIVGVEVIGLVLAFVLGDALFSGLASSMDTKRSIVLSLVIFVMISVWGFILNSVIEFWFLSWSVAIVLGGSQALSRSLYASMSPAAKSGEFFGLYSVMSKFSSIIGPLLFAIVAGLFGNSRPAILSLIVLFVIGGYLLTRVDVEEGQRVAHEEDRALHAAA